ncbi:hypothetical protein VULLAG_LOCUS21024 [Vulpes lagopus]
MSYTFRANGKAAAFLEGDDGSGYEGRPRGSLRKPRAQVPASLRAELPQAAPRRRSVVRLSPRPPLPQQPLLLSRGGRSRARSATYGRSHYDGMVRVRHGGCGPQFPGTLACLAPPSAPESLSSPTPVLRGRSVGRGAVWREPPDLGSGRAALAPKAVWDEF